MAAFADDWVPRAVRMGVFTTMNAYDEGMSRSAVRHRLATGRWRRVLASGIAHAREPDSPALRAAAAHATWPDGVLCLTTAALLHGMPVDDDRCAHMVVPVVRAPIGDLVPHRWRLDRGDVMGIGPLRLTTRARTVIDCLGRLDAGAALDLLAWAASRRVIDSEGLHQWLGSHPGAWGNARRRGALARLESGAMSAAEDLLHEILRRARVTGWRASCSLLDDLGVAAVADVWFPAVRLVIEVDGRRAHGADRFQADRTRQNALVGAGCTVLRYTWQDLTARPTWVADQVTAVRDRLAASGFRGDGHGGRPTARNLRR